MLKSVFICMSLDGFIAKPDGDLKWLDQFNTVPNEDYGFKQFFSSIDAVILGRKTYDTCSDFDMWPYKEKRTIVLSNTLEHALYDVELYRGELTDLIAKLSAEGVKKIWVDGGMTICSFLEKKLVDEITITVIPVLLGEGIPLFHRNCNEHSLSLFSAKSYSTGLTQLQYKVA